MLNKKVIAVNIPELAAAPEVSEKAYSNYEIALSKANPEQLKAIKTTEGVVIVIAGPGTGKTQILSTRIAHILNTKQAVRPQEVLALTFTDSGVKAMRDRLLGMIGEKALTVNIHTFHSFCNNIIRQEIDKFIINKMLQMITEIESTRVLKDLIDGLEETYDKAQPPLRPFGATYHYLNAIRSNIDTLKREDILTDYFYEFLDKLQQAFNEVPDNEKLNQRKGAYYGKIKGDYQKIQENINKLKQLAGIYEGYRNKLKSLGRYDYADMIGLVLDMFQKDEDFLAYYQDIFKYVLVDEYQDTNNAQNMLVHFLVKKPSLPNLFIVGDDEQGIYGFQGANIDNFLFFYRLYSKRDVTVIPLKTNYRSTQKIINAARGVINKSSRNIASYIDGFNKYFVSVNKSQEDDIQVVAAATTSVQYYYVVEKIKELYAQGKKYKDIAVIFRKNSDAERLAKLLHENAIPLNLSTKKNILNNMYVQKLVDFLRLLYIQDNVKESNRALFSFLAGGFLDLAADDLFKINRNLKNEDHSIIEMFRLKDENYQKIINETDDFKRISEKGQKALEQLVEMIYQTNVDRYNYTVPDLLVQILNNSGIVQKVAAEYEAGKFFQALKDLISFVKNRAKEFEEIQGRAYRLEDLMADFDFMYTMGISINRTDLSVSNNGVNLTTAHSAKGLEWDTVFVINANSSDWENHFVPEHLPLPVELIKKTDPVIDVNSDTKEHIIEDERRLFYVAMTRAKSSLFLCYSEKTDEGKPLSPSSFVSAIEEKYLKKVDMAAYHTDEKQRLAKELATGEMPQELTIAASKAYLKNILENYIPSVSALNDFRKCPRYFMLNRLYRIPTTQGKASVLGSVFHSMVEKMNKEFKMTGEFPKKQSWVDTFKMELNNYVLTENDKRDILNEGLALLQRHYEQKAGEYAQGNLLPPVALEIELKVIFEGREFFVKIDSIEPSKKNKGSEVICVDINDIKTGESKSENAILGKTKNSDGNELRQMLAYRMAFELARDLGDMPYQLDKTTLEYARDGKKVAVPLNAALIKMFRQELQAFFEALDTLEFPATEDKQKCKSYSSKCNFCGLCFKED